jgi:large subunit ribosomal protein L29
MKVEEIRKKTEKELHKILAEQRDELREIRFKVASRQLKDYKKVDKIKKIISRILTIMKEKKLLESISKESK